MPSIRITGVPLLDGDYPFDPAEMTMGDYMTIDRISGISVLELEEALARGKAGLFVALAVVALQKSGKPFSEEALMDAPMGSVVFVGDDAAPLAPEKPDGGDATQPISGDASNAATESSPAATPHATGAPV